MSKTKRTRYSAEFKARVALEALKGEKTIAELAAKFGVRGRKLQPKGVGHEGCLGTPYDRFVIEQPNM